MKKFKKFISYYKPHLGLFIFDTVCCLLIAGINLVYPYFTKKIINELVPNKMMETIIIAAIIVVGIYLIKALLQYMVTFYGHKVGVLMQRDMRNELFAKLQKLPVTYFDENKSGTIMSRIINDLMDIAELAHHGPEDTLIAVITIIGAFIMMIQSNLYLTLIVFAILPFYIGFGAIARIGLKKSQMATRIKTAEINAEVENSVTGIRVSKAYVAQEHEKEKFAKSNQNFVNARMKNYHHMGVFHSTMILFSDLLYLSAIIASGVFFYYDLIDAGTFTEFVLYVAVINAPIRNLITLYDQIQNGSTGFERFYEIIELKNEMEKDDAIKLESFDKSIEFKNVSFKYNGENVPYVLKDFSLKVNKGTTVALVGPSGGGKTTICHLLPRFYDVTNGEIDIDGKNIQDFTLDSLRTEIGIVAQDVFLFAGSVKENIVFGKLDATDEQIYDACKKANIYEFIMSLPEGFDTYVGERGVKLSGGQKQRISIARAFLKNPDILILDEATSALDNVTELQIQSSLEELSKGRTTIVVAHRLSTVKNADEIVVIGENGIEEQGSHEKLMKENGVYANLYSLQFKQ